MYIDLCKKCDGVNIDPAMEWETTKMGSQHFCMGAWVHTEADFRRGVGFQVVSGRIDGRVGLGASASAFPWLLGRSVRLAFQLLHFHHTLVDG